MSAPDFVAGVASDASGPGEEQESGSGRVADQGRGIAVRFLNPEGCPHGFVAVLAGYIDLSNVAFVGERLAAEAGKDMNLLILDCSGVGFISASGIGMLVTVAKELRKLGGDMIIAGMSKNVFDFFRNLGYGEYFNRADSVEAAIQYAGSAFGDGFPAAIPCPACGVALKVGSPGTYRCPACGSGFSMDERGRPGTDTE